MSADHEASYYEIALTNRQVLTVFVVLLICLVAAFLSGVWIGRNDRGGKTLAEAAEESPLAQATSQMTELNFFSDAPPLRQERRPAPPLEATAEPRPTPPPATEATEPPARAEPAPVPPPPEPEPAVTQPAAPPPAAVSGPVIQVFSTADVAQARRLVQRLGAGGYPVFLHSEDLGGRTMYRVRVGPYTGEGEAQKIAAELRREYRLETWITSQQPG